MAVVLKVVEEGWEGALVEGLGALEEMGVLVEELEALEEALEVLVEALVKRTIQIV